jgi:hypothetical protein
MLAVSLNIKESLPILPDKEDSARSDGNRNMQIPAHPEIHIYAAVNAIDRPRAAPELQTPPPPPGIVVTLSQSAPAVDETGAATAPHKPQAQTTPYREYRDASTKADEFDSPDGDVSASDKAAEAQAQEQYEDLQKIRQLQSRDREVKAHEAAHAAVGGHLTGSPSFTFERGPDGVNYAVGGEVSVASPTVPGDAEKTLQQAEQVQRAALAPANPSSQDRRVAADAARAAAEARLQLAQEHSALAQNEESRENQNSDQQTSAMP